ncbi:hypothetical protein PoB_000625500 [Plakobranchus ocellatus]|uniref:Uncharacterized protein n=1 Tax=Plakobranchus ocellatus TaxID=259542 RepID=A0AAV3YB80_9GAST|nr:hypothetical protein PoB_000625500 [Plakobranchus ocellatus]
MNFYHQSGYSLAVCKLDVHLLRFPVFLNVLFSESFSDHNAAASTVHPAIGHWYFERDLYMTGTCGRQHWQSASVLHLNVMDCGLDNVHFRHWNIVPKCKLTK